MLLPILPRRLAHPLASCLLLLLPQKTATAQDGSQLSQPAVVVSMRAYFHADIRDYFLLQSLVPLNAGHYFCACLVTFLLTLSRVAIQVATPRLESSWCDAEHYSSARSSPTAAASPGDCCSLEVYRDRLTRLKIAAERGLWSTLSLLVSTLAMLIIMSFNLGFFLAALIGHFTGVFFMSSWGTAADVSGRDDGEDARVIDPDLVREPDRGERRSELPGQTLTADR